MFGRITTAMTLKLPPTTLLAARVRWPKRPVWPVEALIATITIYFIAACNGPFWRALLQGRDLAATSTWAVLVATCVAAVGLHLAVFALFATRRTAKPMLIVLSVVTAVATVFMRTYMVYLDPTMLRNVLNTDWAEARELLAMRSVASMTLYALPPIALVNWIRLRERALAHAVLFRIGTVLAASCVSVLALLLVMQDLAPLMRMQREVRYLLTPGNLIYSTFRNISRSSGAPLGRVHAQAKQTRRAADAGSRKPILLLLVVGETARGANFSLNGYERQTNPQLQKLDVISFLNVSSCGTATEVSLPCMFSPFGRREYDEDVHQVHDGLLQVLAHSGYRVIWRENQSGCKGVCEGDGIIVQHAREWAPAEKCPEGRCLDEVLLEGLDGLTAAPARDTVVVLHQLGNHGPAYYKRYPPAFQHFVPTCDTTELRTCNREQIVNTYDNAILYTDDLLAKAVRFLQTRESLFDTAFLYVSDHGESLGERGLYLHGLPYAIAPDTQTSVPMIMWLSDAFSRQTGVSTNCIRLQARASASHDNLFHSVLGLLSVSTPAYLVERDLFGKCRNSSRWPPPPA